MVNEVNATVAPVDASGERRVCRTGLARSSTCFARGEDQEQEGEARRKACPDGLIAAEMDLVFLMPTSRIFCVESIAP
jgi:hypothetical protein